MSPRNREVLNVAIIGPMDVDHAKEGIERALRSWNRSTGNLVGLYLDPQRYPIDTAPTYRPGLDGQSITSDQIIRSADIIFAVFLHSLGTRTARGFGSGTEEEINIAIETNKPCHIYFTLEPPPPEADSLEMSRVDAFRECLHQRSFLTGSWPAPDGWGGLVSLAIGQDIKDLGLLREYRSTERHSPSAQSTRLDLSEIAQQVRAAQEHGFDQAVAAGSTELSHPRVGVVDGQSQTRETSKRSTSASFLDDAGLEPSASPGDIEHALGLAPGDLNDPNVSIVAESHVQPPKPRAQAPSLLASSHIAPAQTPHVFLSYCRQDSSEHGDFVPPMAADLQAEFEKIGGPVRTLKAHLQRHYVGEWQMAEDYDPQEQSIFVPIVTLRWLRSEARRREYDQFLTSYHLTESDSPDRCRSVARRVLPLVLSVGAPSVLGVRQDHAAQTLLSHTINSTIQLIPDVEEVRRRGSQWERWIRALAQALSDLDKQVPASASPLPTPTACRDRS